MAYHNSNRSSNRNPSRNNPRSDSSNNPNNTLHNDPSNNPSSTPNPDSQKLRLNSKNALIGGGLLAGIGGLIALLVSTVLRDSIIIENGIRTYNNLAIGSRCIALLSLPMIGYGLSLRFRAQHLERRAAQQNFNRVECRVLDLVDYSKDNTNPELTRQWLEQLCTDTPALSGLVTRCLTQMDTMDNLQSRQSTLIIGNNARYLQDTTAVLDNVERRLCQNLRSVINLCIATDSDQALNLTQVNRILDANSQLLGDARALLQASAEWINQYNSGTVCDNSEVTNWITVIRQSLEEESQ